jgi:hypothetical protein
MEDVMYNPEVLAQPFKRNLWVLNRQVEGLTHADSLHQPEPRGNCLNYLLGHLMIGRDKVLDMLGKEKLLCEDEKTRYDSDVEPITGDGEGVINFERLLDMMSESTGLIEEALKKHTPEDMEQEVEVGQNTATLGYWIEFFGWHDTYHIGQTEYLRQLAGTDDKVI